MRFHHRQRRHLAPPEQLELPLDYSRSASAVPLQSPVSLNFRRSRRWQDRPATIPTTPSRLDIVPVSCNPDTKNNHQRQRFSLTPTLSTLINEVNGKRWPHVSALPPFLCRTFAQLGEGRAHVRGRSSGRLPSHSVVSYRRQPGLPALPMRCGLHL